MRFDAGALRAREEPQTGGGNDAAHSGAQLPPFVGGPPPAKTAPRSCGVGFRVSLGGSMTSTL
jgi:hypothetical protein